MDLEVMQVITGYAHQVLGLNFNNNERLKKRFTYEIVMNGIIDITSDDLLSEYFRFIDQRGKTIFNKILEEQQ